ncbi:rhodanese-like domain-containing protein [Cerasicoccus arenae]|uniref:Sulfurtransferase n=1 Tax=Cerasicoccus arenae TaxID=424488 RepID=A0A8J3GEX2_9BACT|nr:rhodanese-like domain-containing protein [Cerasicoccus arenae]MBK1858735.1 rhodanese-like domain-containing protein [Cerasicoccus arenae]GHC07216.1 sulfurtransferase [Cerasicoccus arenae]
MNSISPQQLSDNLRHAPDEWFLIDVRSPGEYRSGHIDGASNYPVDQLDATTVSRLADAANGRKIVLICQSSTRSKRALEIWAKAGHNGAVELDGGMSAWPGQAGLTSPTGGAISLDRQVRIVAGANIFVGTLLGAFVNPWFLLIPGFFGAGLTFAGLTGACGLALLLTKMPWNR